MKIARISKLILIAIISLILISKNAASADLTGDQIKWHKLSISFSGPSTSELATPNPFSDFRLDVTFKGPSGQIYLVPGFFAGDGNAAETSADSGSIWRVNFCPDESGIWEYSASFVSGPNIAAELEGGEPAGYFDGQTGTITISENVDTDIKDFRNKGKLEYVGDHFLQFRETGEYFLKAGANSPEVFLEYAEFDNTPSYRTYPDHIADWKDGDPLWQSDKGKGIIGVVNYLSSIDINAFYFLTMNAYGDGKKAWPWIHEDSIFRYDVSKLDQWDLVFEYMSVKGIMVHFVLTETENESYFEIMESDTAGGFADSRKIYYREMVARFAYLPAITWDVGEENGWHDNRPFQIANTDQQRKDACDRLRALSYYNDHISIHNGPSWDDHIYDALLGHQSMTGPAFQWDNSKNIYNKILEWRNKSNASGHKWVVSLDEAYTNPELIPIDKWRRDNVWPTFMAGGAGIELYVGAGKDLNIQEFRKYSHLFGVMSGAVNFFSTEVKAEELLPNTTVSQDALTLQKEDSLYVLFFPEAENNMISLPENTYNVLWYNPREGLEFEVGTLNSIQGGDNVIVGLPLSDSKMDWACKLLKTNPFEASIDVQGNEYTRVFEESSADLSKYDTIIIQKSGFGPSDSSWLLSSDTSLIDLELISFSEDEDVFVVKLKPIVNTLSPDEYLVYIGVNSNMAVSVNLTYKLLVNEVVLSNEEIDKSSDLRLRTNLVQSHLEFEGDIPGTAALEIYNFNGILVHKEFIKNKSDFGIDVSHFEQGMYIIQLESESDKASFKFLKMN